MPRKNYKPEEIVAKLRQVDVLTSQGQSVAEAIRSIGVSRGDLLPLWTALPLQDGNEWIFLIRGKHLSGVGRLLPERPNGESAHARLYSW